MGFSGCRKQRWSPKCCHFLFRSPFSLAKQEVSAFCCLLLIDPCLFHRKGVSGNTEHNGEVQNGFTSCFAYQTGSASSFLPFLYWLICAVFIQRGSRVTEYNGWVQNVVTSCFVRQTGSASTFVPVIDWFVPFSQEGGYLGCGTLWWSPKWCHFLFCSPDRECQRFPACNLLGCGTKFRHFLLCWPIRAVFTGKGFLGLTQWCDHCYILNVDWVGDLRNRFWYHIWNLQGFFPL